MTSNYLTNSQPHSAEIVNVNYTNIKSQFHKRTHVVSAFNPRDAATAATAISTTNSATTTNDNNNNNNNSNNDNNNNNNQWW